MRLRMTPLCVVFVIAFTVAAFAAPAGAKTKTKTKTYSSGTINLPVVDDQGPGGPGPLATSPIKVKNKGEVKNVNVAVRISARRDRDVNLYLFRGETYIELSTDNGAVGNDYGAGTPDCNGVPTLFDGGAPTFIQFGDPPFAGFFKPEESLGLLNGLSTKASWKLVAFDDEVGQRYTINCWKLQLRRKIHK
jgi:subtilisin-like proprotein convertase family protein